MAYSLAVVILIAAVALAMPGAPDFAPHIYADGEAWGAKVTTELPAPKDKMMDSFNKLFVIINDNNPQDQLPVAEAGPRNPMYAVVTPEAGMSYYFSKVVTMSFDEAGEKVTEELRKDGFSILTQVDVKETRRQKLDVGFREYQILGACNPPFTYQALKAEPRIGLMLPCNVIVQEDRIGRTDVAAIDPVASMAAVENNRFRDIGNEVRAKLSRAVESL
jgi:uncharacterized protein (DUF302 family)